MSRMVRLATAALALSGDRAARRAKGAARRVALYGAAGGLALFGAVYLSIAGFLALAAPLGSALAALIVGCILILVGLCLALTALLLDRQPKESVPALPSRQALMNAIEHDSKDMSPYIAVAALAAGFLAGRK